MTNEWSVSKEHALPLVLLCLLAGLGSDGAQQ
jgi:hypothetical protein